MMTLWDMLNVCQCYQEFDVYEGNDYDQNIAVASGTADELRTEIEIFDHLMDEVDGYSVEPDGVIVIRLRNGNYEKRAEERYSEKYVKRWDRFKPESRPWRFSIEIDRKHRGGKA